MERKRDEGRGQGEKGREINSRFSKTAGAHSEIENVRLVNPRGREELLDPVFLADQRIPRARGIRRSLLVEVSAIRLPIPTPPGSIVVSICERRGCP